MVKVVFEIEDADAPRIINAICGNYVYQETVKDEEGNDIPNPISRVKFTRLQTIKFWENNVVAFETKERVAVAKAEQEKTPKISVKDSEQ